MMLSPSLFEDFTTHFCRCHALLALSSDIESTKSCVMYVVLLTPNCKLYSHLNRILKKRMQDGEVRSQV